MSSAAASPPPPSMAAVNENVPNESDDGPFLFYFAIGAMTNPVSLRLRNLKPRRSWPAKLLSGQYRLEFVGETGMAFAVPAGPEFAHVRTGGPGSHRGGPRDPEDAGKKDPEKIPSLSSEKKDVIISTTTKVINNMDAGSRPSSAASSDPSSKFYGVLHEITQKEARMLDDIEFIYTRKDAKAVILGDNRAQPGTNSTMTFVDDVVSIGNGDIVNCFIYSFVNQQQVEELEYNLPAERYIDVLSQGCAHFGVPSEHIDFLQKMPNRPRTKPEHFEKLTVDCIQKLRDKRMALILSQTANLPGASSEEQIQFLKEAKGTDTPSRIFSKEELLREYAEYPERAVFLLNEHVFEFIGPRKSTDSIFRMLETRIFSTNGLKKKIEGEEDPHVRNLALALTSLVFDPKYGSEPPQAYEQISLEHRGAMEDSVIQTAGIMILSNVRWLGEYFEG